MVLVARRLLVLSLRMVVLIVLLPLPRRKLDRQVDGLSGNCKHSRIYDFFDKKSISI